MSDFIREVDEDLRHDQFRRFIERYWIVLIILAILVLASVGAWEGYDYLRTQRAQTAGGEYLDALDLARDGKNEEATVALQKVIADGTPGYRLLARFRMAATVGAKDKAAGSKLFDELGTDPTVDPAMQNVARVRAALLMLDSDTYPQIKTRLEPLADANNPMRNTARELLGLAALKAGLTQDAGHYFDAIEADATTSGQMRQRIATLQGLVRGAAKPEASPAPPPSAATPAPAPSAPATSAPTQEPAAPHAEAPAAAAPAAAAPSATTSEPAPPAAPAPAPAKPADSAPAAAAPSPPAPAAPAETAPAASPTAETPAK